MEAEKLKLPHHLSKEYKQMKEDGLIDSNGNYLGEDGLYQSNPKSVPANELVPLSQVSDLVDRMVAEKLKDLKLGNESTNQSVVQDPIRYREDSNIDDIPELRNWEMKDREYEIISDVKAISYSIPVQHTALIPLQYTNADTQTVHILRYSTNQPSFFIEKQSKEPGSVLLSEIIFNFNRLRVPANQVVLQKFLHIHPHKNILFREYDPLAISTGLVESKKLKLAAGNLVFSVGELTNRAIASLEFPHYVDSWEKTILEEEISNFAEKEPKKYIDYTNDPTIKMKGVIKASLANGELIYSNYRFLNKKRETILEIAKNQNEMDELVLYFESGVGRTLYEFLLNKL